LGTIEPVDSKTSLTAEERTSLFQSRFDPEAPDSIDDLVPLIYDELREIAHRQLAGWPNNETLNTTALVHEAYVRLAGGRLVIEKGRAYFFGSASRAMRQVLVDYARKRHAVKRGGGQIHVSLDDATFAVETFASDLLDLDTALTRLAALSERQARIVECRFFGGMTVEETADCLAVSVRTVQHDWALARAYLYRSLRGND